MVVLIDVVKGLAQPAWPGSTFAGEWIWSPGGNSCVFIGLATLSDDMCSKKHPQLLRFPDPVSHPNMERNYNCSCT